MLATLEQRGALQMLERADFWLGEQWWDGTCSGERAEALKAARGIVQAARAVVARESESTC